MAERKTIEELLNIARSQGLAAQLLFVIFSTPTDGWDAIFANADDHLAHLRAMEVEGTLFGAGPLCTEDGSSDGDGMFLVRAESLDEARRIAERDPMHKSGARTYRIQPWIMNEGVISITGRLSDQKVQVR